MEDSHTKKMLDSLADLFLTGKQARRVAAKASHAQTESKSTSDEAAPDAVQAPSPQDSTTEPNDSPPEPARSNNPIAASFADELEGPPPIRLQPKLEDVADEEDERAALLEEMQQDSEQGGPSLRLHTDSDEADEQALKIDDMTTIPEVTRQPAELEAVFLGSLPGFAGPWLTQYAQYRAADHDWVGVVYLDDVQNDVELVMAREREAYELDPTGMSLTEVAERLDRVGLWMINAPTSATPAMLDRLRTIGQWTVLCGADDAAVAGTYRLIKQLAEQMKRADGDRREPRQFNLMVMGASEEKGEQVAEQINVGIGSELARPVRLIGSIKQMTPVSTRVVGSFPDEPATWPQALAAMRRVERSEAEPESPESVATAEEETTDSCAAPIERDESTPDEPAGRPLEDTVTITEEEHAMLNQTHPTTNIPFPQTDEEEIGVTAPHQIEAPSAEPVREDAPAPNEAAAADTGPQLNLAQYISGGALVLEARCPKHPQTQIVLDQDGRLHLLRQHSGDAIELQQCVVDLIEARDWLREHIELIQLTQRQCNFDLSTDPTLHLFTDQAKMATSLITKIGPYVRLHLLNRVTVGNQFTWFCADLN